MIGLVGYRLRGRGKTRRPWFPCLSVRCDRTFDECWEWHLHQRKVHYPELKYTCPYPYCGYANARPDNLNAHHAKKHGAFLSPDELKSTQPIANKRRIWGCGFCIYHETDSSAFSKHIWSHFRTGKLKEQWDNSLCIHSLLRYPDVRPDWLKIIGQSGDGDTPDADQLQKWSAGHIELLRNQLEWDYPGRKSGPALALEAYDLLVRGSQMPSAHDVLVLGSLDRAQPSQSSMDSKPEDSNRPSSSATVMDLTGPSPSPITDSSNQSTSFTQDGDYLSQANATLTPTCPVSSVESPGVNSESPPAEMPVDKYFTPEKKDWSDLPSVFKVFDTEFELESLGDENDIYSFIDSFIQYGDDVSQVDTALTPTSTLPTENPSTTLGNPPAEIPVVEDSALGELDLPDLPSALDFSDVEIEFKSAGVESGFGTLHNLESNKYSEVKW